MPLSPTPPQLSPTARAAEGAGPLFPWRASGIGHASAAELLPEAAEAALIDHLEEVHLVREEVAALAPQRRALDIHIDARAIGGDDEEREAVRAPRELAQPLLLFEERLAVDEVGSRAIELEASAAPAARLLNREKDPGV